jgi:hypothetical protein
MNSIPKILVLEVDEKSRGGIEKAIRESGCEPMASSAALNPDSLKADIPVAIIAGAETDQVLGLLRTARQMKPRPAIVVIRRGATAALEFADMVVPDSASLTKHIRQAIPLMLQHRVSEERRFG